MATAKKTPKLIAHSGVIGATRKVGFLLQNIAVKLDSWGFECHDAAHTAARQLASKRLMDTVNKSLKVQEAVIQSRKDVNEARTQFAAESEAIDNMFNPAA